MEERVAGLGERIRYHKDVETLAGDHPWHRIRAHVPVGSSVLDVGCGSGDLGRFLAVRTKDIDGVEINDDRADSARQYLRTVVTGEAGPSIDAALHRSYDVIVFADVLEHVAQPDQVLAWAASKLAEDGRIIALIPNSANWKFRRKMLRGDWSYAETGYFDRDHLRFFDVRTARALGWSAGLQEIAVEFAGERLPKPLNNWSKGAAMAATIRPNLFAGHVLLVWQQS
jgi:cyclopropane fatty-acyl-phospholipid synthase-like methyltransferase